MKSLIMNRFKPCNCGCSGSDPWHKQTYRRVVKQTSDTGGTVRLPFSTKPVRVTRSEYPGKESTTFGLWIVDRDSIVFDKH